MFHDNQLMLQMFCIVDEHKKMVAEKAEERGFSASQPERVVVSAELRHLQFEENKETHEGGPEELLSDGFPADFGHTSRLQQLLDCKCLLCGTVILLQRL
jgi:hypothetical protein